jgi:hypothetical protein
MLAASRKVFLEILGTGPFIFALTLNGATGLSQFVAAIEEYAMHTPLCSHTPHNLGNFNTAYSCEGDGMINHIHDHAGLGIASFPLYLGVDAHLNFTEAVALGEAALAQPPTTSVTADLMHNDFQRLQAVREYDEVAAAIVVDFWQGIVLTSTVFVSLVLARGALISTNDVLRWRVAKAEFGAVGCTATNVMLVLALGSSRSDQRYLYGGVRYWVLIDIILTVQMGCLYKTCHDIVRDKHVHVSTRAPRASAVVPHALPRGSDKGGEGPGLEPSPATPASIDPPVDWSATFARMAKQQDEKYERAMKEQDEKYERAMKERDEKYERSMKERDEKYERAMKERDEKHELAMKERDEKCEELRGMLEENAKALGSSQHKAVRTSEL